MNINVRKLSPFICALAGCEGRDAKSYQQAVAKMLRRHGWHVRLEVPQAYRRPDGRLVDGRVDIVASKSGIVLAMELDAASPREKSKLKLAAFPADVRVVLLRKSRSAVGVFDKSEVE